MKNCLTFKFRSMAYLCHIPNKINKRREDYGNNKENYYYKDNY